MLDYNIDLCLTQFSGQTSQPPWKHYGDTFQDVVLVENEPILFKVSPTSFSYETTLNSNSNIREKDIINKFKHIYDLDFNIEKYYKFLDNDDKLSKTKDFCKGLRLFKAKNPFESILSSICSANNSIKRWTKSINDIKSKHGFKHVFPSGTFYSHPTPHLINDITALKSCGVGYRAPYMIKASKIFTLEIDVLDFYKMSYEEAFETIIKVPGVGPKVADCILLYGFDFKEAFPTDIWIKRIVSHLYFNDKDITVSKIRDFGIEEFGEYAGYTQLYLFHYARKSGLITKLQKNK